MALEWRRLPAANEGGGGGGGAAVVSSAPSRSGSGLPVAEQLLAASSRSSSRAIMCACETRSRGRVSEGSPERETRLAELDPPAWSRASSCAALWSLRRCVAGIPNRRGKHNLTGYPSDPQHGDARCDARDRVRLRVAMVVAAHAPVHAHGAARRANGRAGRRRLRRGLQQRRAGKPGRHDANPTHEPCWPRLALLSPPHFDLLSSLQLAFAPLRVPCSPCSPTPLPCCRRAGEPRRSRGRAALGARAGAPAAGRQP